MKKLIIKIIYVLAIFVISVLIISGISNKENVDMTAQMPAATYPVVSMVENGTTVNILHGYAQEMQVNYMHGTIMPIGKDRQVQMQMDLFDTLLKILHLKYVHWMEQVLSKIHQLRIIVRMEIKSMHRFN